MRVQRVLIVEDDVDLRRMFRTALTFAGYDVLEVGDGLDALRALDGYHIDLVVLDLGLPFINGRDVLHDIVTQAHTRYLPLVVVVTGQPGPHDLPQANCVLIKPVAPERLVATVQQCIGAGSATSET